MKKISLLLVSLFGATAIVACNGGGSSGGGGGGGGDAPSGCTNGASQCGASSAATQYDTLFPAGTAGSLITANNVVIGNGESVALTFGVKNITSPVTVSFTTDSGNLQSNQSYTFGGPESSYTITLQTNDATSYNVTPSVGATNMTPVTVSTISASMFQLPLGTYKDNSVYIDRATAACTPHNAQELQMIEVNTMSGFYTCLSAFGHSECQISKDSYTLTPIYSRLGAFQLPYAAYGSRGYYFNGTWSNGVFSATDVMGYDPSPYPQNNCIGMIQNIEWQYQSSSTAIPYPVTTSTSLTSQQLVTKFLNFGMTVTK